MLKSIISLILFTFIFSVDYTSEIQPIFNNSCGGCHTTNSSGGLNLSSYDNLMSSDVVVPGDYAASILYDRITRENSEAGDMPPGNSELNESEIGLIAQWINEGALEFESSCEEGFTLIESVPTTCIVFDQSDCFHDGDFQVLADIAESNGIFNLDPLYLGSQNWLNGRLIRIQVGNYFQGGNVALESLPESISNLSFLATLQIDKNSLTSLPSGVGDLSNLTALIASNNFIESIPESVGDLSNVWYLDLGYNNLETLPSSLSNMSSLQYLYLFGNNLSSLPNSICDLDLDWSGLDNSFMPYFACGGNELCDNIPECVANSENFEIALEANYYSFTISSPQDCEENCGSGDVNADASVDVLDVVTTVNIVLGNIDASESEQCAADMNNDLSIDVLDVVTMVNFILN
jgi:hypothetical protein